ncbi:MAG: hypothetical protein D6820_04960 [Lentisphaerae bacterium]|nr:MAG: hypothetical protein D6820_04960 [Lentisphaerota bacterium]
MLHNACQDLPLQKDPKIKLEGVGNPDSYFGLKPGWVTRNDARMWAALARWYFVERKKHKALEETMVSYEKYLGLGERMPVDEAHLRLAQCVSVRLSPASRVSKSTLEEICQKKFNEGYRRGLEGFGFDRLTPEKQRQLLALERKILKLEKCDWAANKALCEFYRDESIRSSAIYPPARFVSFDDPAWLEIRAYYQLRVRWPDERIRADACARAKRLIDEALRRNPKSARAHALMALVYWLEHNDYQMKRWAAKARALDPNDPVLLEHIDPFLTSRAKSRRNR